MVSGGQRSESCGTLLSGAAMQFGGSTDRLLETSDLDLLHATSVITRNEWSNNFDERPHRRGIVTLDCLCGQPIGTLIDSM